ncbi:MAG: DUF1015 domain-containing protein [Actinomycetota bacterium]|nr:DUF1015 domain-containing protein [Actinomycetota bacterium]MDQ2958718.1 DUF1015 domain-containing protein [Actinomycetota bacterium]
MTDSPADFRGLSLTPFRAVRFVATDTESGLALSPPYDVISPADRDALIGGCPTNVVRLILPEQAEAALGDGDPYRGAQLLLDSWLADAVLAVDDAEALFVYEMSAADGSRTRGLLGAVELRDPADGVILPHENTMAGPVSDRLALMTATEANLEPIYLVYDGGGAASDLVASVSELPPTTQAHTPDGITHRLWAITDSAAHQGVADDLAGRRALIADGHHRYATYLKLQANHDGRPGPWDRGLTLLVDTSSYGPQVHPIHRVVALGWSEILDRTSQAAKVGEPIPLDDVDRALAETPGFAVALARGDRAVIVSDLSSEAIEAGLGADADSSLGRLDITILHRVLVEQVWKLVDDVQNVGYAHDVAEALLAAENGDRTAVLVRATPVKAVAEVAAAGQRMPRKSTLFTPKPASGVVIRRFADQ